MKVVFMAKNKNSSCLALQYLLEKKIEIVYAVIPDIESDLKEICKKNNIRIVNDETIYELIEKNDDSILEIDLVISFLFWKKIKKGLIELPKIGCINFHPAPLPEYRGVGGYNFAILDGLNYWGVSAHFVDETIDTGKIIKVNKFQVDSEKIDVIELEKISQIELIELFKSTIEKLLKNEEMEMEIQGEGRYINRNLLEKSKRVDINSSKEEIDKKIRAFWFPPYNGAYIEIDGKKYTLINEEMLQKLK